MKLKSLINEHLKYESPLGLKNNLGDSYLLTHNTIYKNIRRVAAHAGYQFNSNPSADFYALPFSQLENILSTKSIPYTDNVSVVRSLVAKLHDRVTWEDVSDGYRRNYLFHESCHAVVRSQTLKAKDKLFQALLEESFANTCELLAAIDADSSTHQLFLEINSYTFLFESRTYLKQAARSMGMPALFKMMLVGYLYSNFLKTKLSDKKFDQLLSFVLLGSKTKVSAQDLKNLKALCKIPFTLDLRFRTVTTGFYLRLSGLELNDLDPVDVILQDPALQKLIEDLAKLATDHSSFSIHP